MQLFVSGAADSLSNSHAKPKDSVLLLYVLLYAQEQRGQTLTLEDLQAAVTKESSNQSQRGTAHSSQRKERHYGR